MLILAACSRPATESFAVRSELAQFTSNGVVVKVALETDPKQRMLLSATFIPTKAGFHLYSNDLPDGGINGIGLPTRFVVVPGDGILSVGKPFSDVAPKDLRIKELGIAVPIYPEGPVKIRVPIELRPSEPNPKAKLLFTYMACSSDGMCLRPVENKELNVAIPKIP